MGKHLYTHRLDFLWSGCLQRASSSVSTQCRATSGPTAFCCGRSSHWVGKHITSAVHLPLTKQTAVVLMGIFLVLAADSCLGKSPYPNVAVDTKFYKMIQDGFHMTQPDFAPPQMWVIVKLLPSKQCSSLKYPLFTQVWTDDPVLESGAHWQTNL